MNDYSGLSRHERRRQAKLATRHLGSIEIVGDDWLIERAERDPEFAHWMTEWIGRLDILRPLCMMMHCNHEFSYSDPPYLWLAIRPDIGDDQVTMAGLCKHHAGSRTLVADAIEALRRAGLKVRPISSASLSPVSGRA